MKSVAFFAKDSNHRSTVVRDNNSPIFTLPVVLCYEKKEHYTEQNVFKAAAQHMANIMSDRQVHSDSTDWGLTWRAWEKQQFRKVVRRAKPNQFLKLEKDDDAILTEHKTSSGETIKLLSLTPHVYDEPDRRLKNFQVSGLALPFVETETADIDSDLTMVIKPNYSLGASTGKMIAQVCHAVQLMVYESDTAKIQRWEREGRKVILSEENPGSPPSTLVRVIDAGFTELPPNSSTATAGWLNE